MAQRAIKDYNSRVEKETDKMMVTNIVERERMLDSLEKEFRVILVSTKSSYCYRRDKRRKLESFYLTLRTEQAN